MSASSVYVRCVNGAFYRDPMLFCRGGFVSFPALCPGALIEGGRDGLLVVWDRKGEPVNEHQIAAELLGAGNFDRFKSIDEGPVEIEVPTDSEPRRELLAHRFAFILAGPIPEPTKHEGCQRYKSRLRAERVLDPKPAARSARG